MIKSKLLLLAGSLLAFASAEAQLAHRYNLNDANDSVGTANGTLSGGATIANGILTTTGPAGDYLRLPSSVGTGITGNFSIETWVTLTNANAAYISLFSFSSAQNSLILLNPNRPGNGGTGVVANLQQPGFGGGGELHVDSATNVFADGLRHQITLTYNATSGLASVYNNGAFLASNNLGTGFSFQTASSGAFNGINGGGPYTGDASIPGSTADLRVYNSALTAAQVSTLNGLGPDATNAQIGAVVPEPSTWAAAVAGLGVLIGLRRFRRSVV